VADELPAAASVRTSTLMNFSASHLKRYRELSALLWRYGRSDLVKQMSEADGIDEPHYEEPPPNGVTPERLVDDLEKMGPTYVKLGQVLAGRRDLLPQEYLDALARLQDKVKPFPFADVERIVMQELGVRLSKAFSRFDPEPMAAASLGQVHRAALRDGRPVVVKVQRPDIRHQIAEDFEVLEQIASFLDKHTEPGKRYRFGSLLEEFRQTLHQELNYEREAQNLLKLRENLREFPRLLVPEPVMDYCTRTVLTMEEVDGVKVTSISPLVRTELDGGPLLDDLFKAYLKQVLIDGLFHADPHPGNVFLTTDQRIALLDLGMVGHTTPGMQQHLFKLVLSVSDGLGEEVARIIVDIGEKSEDYSPDEFRREVSGLVARRRDRGLEQINVGQSLLDVARAAAENGLFVPSELTLLGKTLLQLDEVGRILDPSFRPNEAVRRHTADLMSQRMRKDVSQGNFFSSLIDLKQLATSLPSRLNRIFDAITNSELEIKVKAIDAKMFLDGMQKIANRITSGVVLAALIIGASLLMRVQTEFQIFGYPGLAMLCFLAAAGGGFWLVINIFVQDAKSKRKYEKPH
jgi:predicted unusual protein kinase regulating ubiquinone biosynthesis (AarF/ABC1/UbiB family)